MRGRFRRLLPALVLLASLTGCQAAPMSAPKTARTTVFAMDTVMDLEVYGQNEAACQAALDRCVEELYALDSQLSPTNPDSCVYALNHAGGEWVEVPVPDLLKGAKMLCALTGGALDFTAYPATLAWGFTTGEYRVPGEAELAELAGRIDYTRLEADRAGGRARLPEGMALDLGAVAKGYAAGVLRDLLGPAGTASSEDAEGADSLEGVDGALLDLGQSTILAVGGKPDGSPWRIGIRDPEGDSYLGVLELRDAAMGTSGGYQRYFEEDGETYWHILDPDTAAPARSGLSSVTVVSPNGLLCDGLSTALFVMGLEEGIRFWGDWTAIGLDFDVIFVTGDGSIFITRGLQNSFTLAEGYEDRQVNVLL